MNTLDPKDTTHVVTRFAPSPTGMMHIGSIRTALFAYLYAKQQGGTFILRIEDTDKEREVAGSTEHIQKSLRWLGINWDYGPDTQNNPFGSCIQSERLPTYIEFAQQLIEKGLAYPDLYTKEEVDAFRATAEAEKRPFLFRNHRPETFEVWDGSKPLRLKAPHIKRYAWTDAVRGPLEAGEEMVDDVIIIKADGYPTYNFAHIIDDYNMGVTHIMRGDEFISSMPKFLSIYDALGFNYPMFVTLPPILREDRTKKLGKRDGAKDILDYKTDGYLGAAMVNCLALIGWNPGTEQEIFTMAELVDVFSIEKIQRGGGVFNDEKLDWINKQHLQSLSDTEFSQYIKPVIPEDIIATNPNIDDILIKLLPLVRERIHSLIEFRGLIAAAEYDFAFLVPMYDVVLLKWKNDSSPKDALPRLLGAINILKTADFTSPDTIKAALMPYAETVGKGELLWPVRIALSGRAQSPDPFTIASIIGQGETLARLQTACGKLGE